MPESTVPDHPLPHPDLTDYVLGALDDPAAGAFAAHLAGCDHCRAEVAELAPLRRVLDEVLPLDGGVPAGLEERTLSAVGQEAAAAAGRPAPARAPRRPRALALVAASAAAGAALALAAVGLLSGRSEPGGREVALVAAGGAGGAGRAEGVARLERGDAGIVVELELDGLAVPPAGSFYECWYVAAGEAAGRPDRVSAGTFTVPVGGRVTARMLTAADPRRYPGIEVTLEPDDGDPASTGPVVLRSPPRQAEPARD